jgi:hypothetical protein
VSAGAEKGGLIFKPIELTALPATTSGDSNTALAFSLRGQAQLVWRVDASELASALAGRDEGAFQTIVGGFEGIEEARARIEPFWKNSFPADPTDIKITVKDPATPR